MARPVAVVNIVIAALDDETILVNSWDISAHTAREMCSMLSEQLGRPRVSMGDVAEIIAAAGNKIVRVQ